MIVTKKHRYSNLELYRIIVMLTIVAHHYVVNTGLMTLMDENPLSPKSLFFYIFGMWGKTGINCFVMITGYFMCKSRITIRKFLRLVLEVEFYNISIFMLFALAGYEEFSIKEISLCLLPIKSISDGFVSCFLAFYLFIPFLNILVAHLQNKEHLILVAFTLGMYTVLGTMPGIDVRMNYVSWFCTLYFVASYIRYYRIEFKGRYLNWGGYMLCSIFLSISSVIGALYLDEKYEMHIGCYRYVSDCNMIFAVTTAITSFMYFKNLKMRYHKQINIVAQSVFGVLLIHANSDAMRIWLWQHILSVQKHFNGVYACAYAIVCVICIFVVCITIDYLRIHTIEKWTFLQIDKILKKYNIQ